MYPEIRQALHVLHSHVRLFAEYTSLIQVAQNKLTQVASVLECFIQQKATLNQHLAQCRDSLMLTYRTISVNLVILYEQLNTELTSAKDLLTATTNIQHDINLQIAELSAPHICITDQQTQLSFKPSNSSIQFFP